MVYELEMKGNNVVIKGLDQRMMLVPLNLIPMLHKEFYKIVGDASRVVLREVGKCFGESVVDVVKKEMEGNDASVDTVLEATVKYLRKSGFGDVKIEKVGDEYVVKIKGSPSLASPEGMECKYDLSSIGCYFEEGVIKGIMEAMLGKRIFVRRDEVNDDTCKIIVKEA